ncbi:DUF6191 domain-containing protein [Streptomyces alanosinicus]|uniref:Regulatory protein n=1 Tax=Streptomyces alanosinicus TaxID=68171 RepID=A0A918YQH6_9ACTN|nr:DUF6191 domain-containing protein [Streptomyces alanosinicus]GHE11301.1 hypothetical protein GCM10010339_70440 [Streptomyces alanosinicus]
MFNAFEELFAPGRKHTRDEQNRLELTREDVGDADPGRGPIDLSSGRAVIRLAGPSPAEEERSDGRREDTEGAREDAEEVREDAAEA